MIISIYLCTKSLKIMTSFSKNYTGRERERERERERLILVTPPFCSNFVKKEHFSPNT
jgi:hypothetical protein